MVNYKINQMKSFNPTINKILREDRYNTEDITEEERKFVEKHAAPKRVPRVDLTPGDIVVVLEGAYTGKKVVFIKQLPECMSLVSGISSINGVSAFKIDERYLFKLSAKVDLPSSISIDASNVFESKMNEPEKIDAEPSKQEAELEKSILAVVSKIPYMKAYLAEQFKVDQDVEFYSQQY